MSIFENKKPSEILLIALADLAKAEQDPKYRVCMSVWHMYDSGVCEVCLAGAVMAFSLSSKRDEDKAPEDFPTYEPVLMALNWFRHGKINTGLKELGYRDVEISDLFTTEYGTSRWQFKEDMLVVVDRLKHAGL